MAHRLHLLAGDGSVAFNLTDKVGTDNPYGLKVWPFSDLLFGFSSGDPVFFPPGDLPGGILVSQRKGLIESTNRFKVDAADNASLRAGVAELDRLLEQGGTLEWQPDGGTTVYIDFETGWSEGLLRGQDVSLLYIRSGDWDGLPLVIVHQPFPRLPDLNSDKNRLRNPSMILLQKQRSVLTANQRSVETDLTGIEVDNANTTLVRDTTQAKHQSASARLTAIAAGSVGAVIRPPATSGFPVTPGRIYTGTAWGRPAGTARTMRVHLNWYTAAGAWISNTFVDVAEVAGNWVKGVVHGVAPPTAAFGNVAPWFIDAAAGEQHYVDEMAWGAGIGGIPANWELGDTFDNNVILGEPTYFSDDEGGGWEVELDPALVPGHIIQQRIDAAEGETVTFSIEAMRVAGVGTYVYELLPLDAAGGVIVGTSVFSEHLSDAAFTRRTLTKANLPAGTAEVVVIFQGFGGAATLRFRKAQLETGAVATDFVTSTEEIPADPFPTKTHPPPPPVATNAGAIVGLLTGGLHSWVMTHVTAAGETLPSNPSNVITVDGVGGGATDPGKADLVIPVGPPETISRKIYRTIAGNTGAHKLVATVPNNTDTTYQDNTPDASLGANAPAANTADLGSWIGRVLLVYNPSEARSPVSFRVKSDVGGMLQAVRFGVRSFGGDLASLLPHFVNGPLVFQGEDSLFGAQDHSVGASAPYLVLSDPNASGGLAFDANPGSQFTRIQRFVYDDVDVLEAFRGPLRVTLRCRNTDKTHRKVQLRWGDSMESPVVHVPPATAHNTDIDGLATFGYVLVDLGTISIPETGTLEGLTIEVWAEDIVSAGGNLICDCVLLSPIEQSSMVSLPYVARAQIAGEGAGTPISIGSNLGNDRWRVTWRYSVQAPSNGPDYVIAFRVRRDNGATGTIIAEIQHEHPDPVTNVTTQFEFDSLDAVAYFTSRTVIAGTATLTVHDITVERVCVAHEDETVVTDPSIGEDRAYVESMDGRLMCEAFPSGPTPFWLQPGWSVVTIDPFEPRHGGLYSELAHNIRRRPVVGHTISPRVRQP